MNGNFKCKYLDNQNIYDVIEVEIDRDKTRVWNSCRAILKEYGWSRHYDNIPYILQKIGYEYRIEYEGCNVADIIEDFKTIVYKFKEGGLERRKYLINYRYIALKLMERHGVVFGYYIPKLQTIRKLPEFERIWKVFESFLN